MANRPSLKGVGEITPPVAFSSDTEQGKDSGGALRRDPLPASASAGEGSRSIPEQWLGVHGDALFRYALLLVADLHRAEDLVQETLLAAFEGRGRYSGEASERTWLIGILRHKAIDERRRDRRHDRYLADVDPVVEGNFNRLGKWRKPPSGWTPNPQSLAESQEFWAIFHSCMVRAAGTDARSVCVTRRGRP